MIWSRTKASTFLSAQLLHRCSAAGLALRISSDGCITLGQSRPPSRPCHDKRGCHVLELGLPPSFKNRLSLFLTVLGPANSNGKEAGVFATNVFRSGRPSEYTEGSLSRLRVVTRTRPFAEEISYRNPPRRTSLVDMFQPHTPQQPLSLAAVDATY